MQTIVCTRASDFHLKNSMHSQVHKELYSKDMPEELAYLSKEIANHCALCASECDCCTATCLHSLAWFEYYKLVVSVKMSRLFLVYAYHYTLSLLPSALARGY